MSPRLPRFKGAYLRTRVARRLLGVFVLCAVAPVVALGLLSRRELTTHLNAQKEEDLRRITEISRNALLERLFAISSEFEALALALEESGGAGELGAGPRVVSTPSGYRGLGIVRPDGADQLIGQVRELPALGPGQLRHLAGGRPLLVTDVFAGGIRILLAASLDTLEPAAAVLWGEVDPFALGVERVAGHLLPAGGGLCAFDGDLRAVACTGDPAPPIRGSEELAAAPTEEAGRSDEILEWSAGEAAYTGTHRSAFLAYELGAEAWTVVLGAPRAAAFQAPRAYEIASLAFLALAIAVMFFLSNVLIRRTMQPVGALSDAARSIASGEFATIVDVRSGNEFEELAASFNYMSVEVGRLVERLGDLGQGALEALARAIDAKSRWTGGHSTRVANLSVVLGRELGLSPEDLERLHRGGLLHDMGKVGISSAILDKPGRLTDEEMRAVREHPQIGADILAPIEAFADIIPIVRHHHERYDGQGYPLGLAGEEIPLTARVLQVADVYDALTNDRPYRKALTNEEVVDDFTSVAGTQFDPAVVSAFIGLMQRAEMDEPPRAHPKPHDAPLGEPAVPERMTEEPDDAPADREMKREVVTQ